jgi:hypothetical protein
MIQVYHQNYTINHFINNHAQTLNDYYLETDGVCFNEPKI